MRFFNTAGPVRCQEHYCLPPLSRLDLDGVMTLIGQRKYFVLHAPRQAGKTTYLLALMDHLNGGGTYRCLYVNAEVGQFAREDAAQGVRALLGELASRAQAKLGDAFPESIWQETLAAYGAGAALNQVLTRWCAQSARPVVLLVDEIDALIGDTLIAVLRQLRAGYDKRPGHFPQSIVLCGVRDVRDYRIHSDVGKAVVTGGSAFNIKAESLRLGDFGADEIATLYGQHTAETGQMFEPAARDAAWVLTRGQPWLVNALAYEACFRMPEGRDRAHSITADLVFAAKERLIERRETHLDQLADKLREDRVRRVIEPIVAGTGRPAHIPTDDIEYAQDLGLIRTEGGQLAIANAIYQEVIPRALTHSTQLTIAHETAWYVLPDGRLDMDRLLEAFQAFFREHSEHWVERFDYKEAGPQLLLQAFLQRIVNGGGRIEREYGLGRRRTDLLVVWPHPGGTQKVVVELKLLRGTWERTLAEGLAQTRDYAVRCGADSSHLVVFDRSPNRGWDEKVFARREEVDGGVVTVWGV